MEQTLPVNGASVVMRSSSVEGGGVIFVWLCDILFFKHTCETVDCIRLQRIQVLRVDLFAVSYQAIFTIADSEMIRAIRRSYSERH